MTRQRRHFSGPEKVAALKRHLVEKTPVSDLCDELGIAPNLFYRWQKEFFEGGHVAFDNGRKAKAVEDAKDKKIEQLEAKQQRTSAQRQAYCLVTFIAGLSRPGQQITWISDRITSLRTMGLNVTQ